MNQCFQELKAAREKDDRELLEYIQDTRRILEQGFAGVQKTCFAIYERLGDMTNHDTEVRFRSLCALQD